MMKEFQQYYPTYHYKDRDVVLVEFEEAQRIANSQTKLYGQTANILLAFVAILISIFPRLNKIRLPEEFGVSVNNYLLLDIIYFIFGMLVLRYFVELQRDIVINSRKVVTLRSILGLSYGSLHLTLPIDRIEGADNPFKIKYFKGWLSLSSMPFWVLMISCNLILIYAYFKSRWPLEYVVFGLTIQTIILAYIFRKFLNDTHETFYLRACKVIASLINLRLLNDFEYILFRVKLAKYDIERLKYQTANLKKILICVEDQCFMSHSGVSFKSIFRAALSQIKFIREKKDYLKSGGSTITMQLVRTLFIPSGQSSLKRKLLEILLAFWLESQFTKEEILDFYISSVRFERGFLGLSKAMPHFFSREKKKLSNAEALFLVERLSNISSSFRMSRIKHLVKIVNKNCSLNINEDEVLALYQEMSTKLAIRIV